MQNFEDEFNENNAEIENLMHPKEDTMDELSRLYELNFYNTSHKKNALISNEFIINCLPREIAKKEKNHNKKLCKNNKLYTVGAVEYGLPVPVVSQRCYNSSIVQKHAHVLNTQLSNFYKAYHNNN